VAAEGAAPLLGPVETALVFHGSNTHREGNQAAVPGSGAIGGPALSMQQLLHGPGTGQQAPVPELASDNISDYWIDSGAGAGGTSMLPGGSSGATGSDAWIPGTGPPATSTVPGSHSRISISIPTDNMESAPYCLLASRPEAPHDLNQSAVPSTSSSVNQTGLPGMTPQGYFRSESVTIELPSVHSSSLLPVPFVSRHNCSIQESGACDIALRR
jgi:hypothetical protein